MLNDLREILTSFLKPAKTLLLQGIDWTQHIAEERKQARKIRLAEREQKKALQAELEHSGYLPLPATAWPPTVREYPEGIRIIKRTPGMVKLRFYAFRGQLFAITLCSLALMMIFSAMLGIYTTPYPDSPIPRILLIWLILIAISVPILIPRVVVTITKNWLKFGNQYYLMESLGQISTGGEITLQSEQSSQPSIFTFYWVQYGPWGEKTGYMSTRATTINHIVFINDLLESIRDDTSMHSTETGRREQKF